MSRNGWIVVGIIVLIAIYVWNSNSRASQTTAVPPDEISDIQTEVAEQAIYDKVKEAEWDSYAETAQAEDYAPLPESPADLCISWKEAHLHVGEETCVTGIVTSTYNSGNAFFMNFSSNRSSFYLVSFDFTWDNLRGECVVAHGKIILYENRPEIIIRDPNQLESCR